ncbi:hypothetical protein L798_09622 [Zootermopsis nevadensis]|uniref:Uncharacterized protein n=1 Tax=Zootermopsis nevadensis TaxID=136037 RepID=A0A067R0F0_ZOONE|nr:hypothetical protein L798_09622 [Zootermopsis nevadensis]
MACTLVGEVSMLQLRRLPALKALYEENSLLDGGKFLIRSSLFLSKVLVGVSSPELLYYQLTLEVS